MKSNLSQANETNLLIPLSLPVTKPISKKPKNPIKKKKIVQLTHNNVHVIHNPSKHIPNNYFYRLDGDVFINDSWIRTFKESECGLLASHNNFKKILSITHDLTHDLIITKNESYGHSFQPIELLIDRLMSIGDQEAYNLTENLKKYIVIFENYRKIRKKLSHSKALCSYDKKEFKDYLLKNENLIKKFNNLPSIFWRSKVETEFLHFETFELSFNKNFLNLLNCETNKFIKNAMKHGYPDCLVFEGNYLKLFNKILEVTFLDKNNGKCDLNYIIKSEFKEFNCQTDFEINVFCDENIIELFIAQSFEVKIEKFNFAEKKIKNKKKNDKKFFNNFHDGANLIILEESHYRENDIKFLQKFYSNIQVSDERDIRNLDTLRCSYRNLDLKK